MTTTISVIIPVYNTGKLASELIDQLLNSKYQDIEIIVIDDGSDDDSLKILKLIKDSRVKVFHKKNGGPSSARNLGLEKATGRYISFIDSDDQIASDFLPKLAKSLSAKDVVLAATGIKYHRVKEGTDHEIYSRPFPLQKRTESFKAYILRLLALDGRLYAVTNKLFRADFAKNLRFDETMNFAEDTKFVLDYLAAAERELTATKTPSTSGQPLKIHFIPEPLLIYNYGTATSTVKTSSLEWANWQKSYDALRAWLGDNPSHDEQKRLKNVLRRWKISHALAVARSDKPKPQKLKYLKGSSLKLVLASIVVRFRR